MKKYFISSVASVAALAMATSAHATVDLTVVLPTTGTSDAFSTDSATPTDVFTIVLGASGYLTASFTGVPKTYFSNISGGLYSGATLIKAFTFFDTTTTTFGELASTFVSAPGAYTFQFTGATLGAGYGGSATLAPAAVPEPATWALMFGGLGLVGMTMRRRTTKVSFA